MSANKKVPRIGLMFCGLAKFNYEDDSKRFEKRMKCMPNEVWINADSELKCKQLRVIKKTNISKNHYYLVCVK